mmetsp:Transcript_17308/g.46191  ORF Transcript_17308/g.46191 Transcript_17308/m.46191 type:complete len:187 (+) Transcript_17308:1264-1824(+)
MHLFSAEPWEPSSGGYGAHCKVAADTTFWEGVVSLPPRAFKAVGTVGGSCCRSAGAVADRSGACNLELASTAGCKDDRIGAGAVAGAFPVIGAGGSAGSGAGACLRTLKGVSPDPTSGRAGSGACCAEASAASSVVAVASEPVRGRLALLDWLSSYRTQQESMVLTHPDCMSKHSWPSPEPHASDL